MTTAIIDYGSGNLRSAAKAFERAAFVSRAGESGTDETIVVTSRPEQVEAKLGRIMPLGAGWKDAIADQLPGKATDVIHALGKHVGEDGTVSYRTAAGTGCVPPVRR